MGIATRVVCSMACYGGEGEVVDDVDMEELVHAEAPRSEIWLHHAELVSIWVREDQVAAAKKPG